jgi:hypothetical protein
MSKLTEYQKANCPKHLECEDWGICSKCRNVKVVEAQFCGSSVKCSLKPIIPKVFTVIGKDKTSILHELPEIIDKMSHGYNRGKVNDVFWSMDEKVPSYFTHDYNAKSETDKK